MRIWFLFTELSNSLNWWKAYIWPYSYDFCEFFSAEADWSSIIIFDQWPRFDLDYDLLNLEGIRDLSGLWLVRVFEWKLHFEIFAYLDWKFSSQYFDKDHLHICNASQQALEIKKNWISLNSMKAKLAVISDGFRVSFVGLELVGADWSWLEFGNFGLG